MFAREPAVIIAALVAILQGGYIYLTGDIGASAPWIVPVATIVGGWLTRRKVTPV